ncbi:hypothetical protein HZA55_01455 [Candidatus Poribacteria bacterium]|nr:hypothetical protein [Candidatus Poribacteria bacterium]
MKKEYSHKKLTWILIIILGALIANSTYYYLYATVANSGHDIISGASHYGVSLIENQGTCSFCHIPHGASGPRLNPKEMNAGDKEIIGEVGQICNKCHDGTWSFAPNINASILYPLSSNNGSSHPMVDDDSTPDTQQFRSGWPYTYDTTDDNPATTEITRIECTSCHSVHEQNNGKPVTQSYAKKGNFLNAPVFDTSYKAMFNPPLTTKFGGTNSYDSVYDTATAPAKLFCTYCHINRAYEQSGMGTHPINKTGSFTQYTGSGVYINRDRFAIYETTPIQSYQDLDPKGGHLSAFETGTVICNTCHKAHGAAPGKNLLVIDNNIYRSVDSNVTYAKAVSNSLCIDCHSVKPSLSDTSKVYFAHPVGVYTTDLISTRGNNLYINIPEGWPVMDSTERKGIVCLSCHKVHGARKDTKMLRPNENGNKGDKRICDDCHCPNPQPIDISRVKGPENDTTNPLSRNVHGSESHPVKVTLRTSDDTTVLWPNNDWLRLFDTSGAQINTALATKNNGYLSCETCHNVHRAYSSLSIVEWPGDVYSEICVGCHTDYKKLTKEKTWAGQPAGNPSVTYTVPKFEPSFDLARTNYLRADSSGGYYSNVSYYDSINAYGANPSKYIIEYDSFRYESVGVINSAYKETKGYQRLGTHPSGIRIDNRYSDTSYCYDTSQTRLAGFIFRSKWQFREWGGLPGGDKFPASLNASEYFSNQRSYWGKNDSTIICQSCHTPHGAAKGLVEYNPGANESNDATPNSALLLSNNIDSNLCTTCHRNYTRGGKISFIVAHPLSIPVCGDTTYLEVVRGNFDNKLKLYRETDLGGNPQKSTIWDYVTTRSVPANYPKPVTDGTQLGSATAIRKLVCDSCHTPHAAETSSGSKILEAGAVISKSNVYLPQSAENADINVQFGGRRYQSVDVTSFCHQCHAKKAIE